jgi:glutaminyl-tRNA synthetase
VANGKAYVDFTEKQKIKEMRRAGIESEYRSMPTDYHISEFNKMLNGDYPEDRIVLRLKISMTHHLDALRDPIAYRVRNTPHYRTGTTYHVYPTYDYSHGIVDSLEKITDSYCTMEFYLRHEQYLWPVRELGLIPATVVEFGRLDVEGVTLSKRKIIPLIHNKTLSGFDDPRLYTIRGLRRRGFPADVLKKIVAHTSMERHNSTIAKALIDHELREHLGKTAPRAFAVIDPIKVVIDGPESETIYIERSDFREVDSKEYYRLAPGKTIRLKYSDFVQYKSHTADQIVVSHVTPDMPKKVKGIIHWVKSDAQPAVFEFYDEMKIEIKNGFVDRSVMEKLDITHQFERIGYFRFDRYVDGKPVFINVIPLKVTNI